MPKPIFSFKNIIHEVRGKKILTIKKFEMHRGAAYVVDGNMGSGKTSLINILARNIKITSGDCEYEQKKLSTYSSQMYKDQIAVVSQEFNPPFGTVEKFLKKIVHKLNMTILKLDDSCCHKLFVILSAI